MSCSNIQLVYGSLEVQHLVKGCQKCEKYDSESINNFICCVIAMMFEKKYKTYKEIWSLKNAYWGNWGFTCIIKYVQKQKRQKKFFKGETIKLKLNVSNLFFKY